MLVLNILFVSKKDIKICIKVFMMGLDLGR